ncbi:hypothetical protein QUA69_22220 [Microcoleus sp. LAD1_D1]|uniref:hypothetical protein n=1 Tax=Microcoleus sp. LAD1_D1 TaxID=2818812 RepID=UPI002FD5DDAD
MRHPFELEISDLEAVNFNIEEELTGEEATQVTGGLVLTTLALGEEGGRTWPPIIKRPIKPPILTTMALGEEGGSSLL